MCVVEMNLASCDLPVRTIMYARTHIIYMQAYTGHFPCVQDIYYLRKVKVGEGLVKFRTLACRVLDTN